MKKLIFILFMVQFGTMMSYAQWQSIFHPGVNSIAVNSKNIFVTLADSLWYSSNNGNNWRKLDNVPWWNKPNIYNVYINITNLNSLLRLIVYRGYQTYVSDDTGKSWFEFTLPEPGNYWRRTTNQSPEILTVFSDYDGTYAGTNGNGIFYFDYTGIYRISGSWVQTTLNNQHVNAICSDVQAGEIRSMFAGTDNGVYYSRDRLSWTQTFINERVFSLAVNDSHYVFAGTSNGVFVSSNHGQNWTQTLNNSGVKSIVTKGSLIFVALESNVGNASVFFSTNNGKTWTDSPINEVFINFLCVSENHIFACTQLQVWRCSLLNFLELPKTNIKVPKYKQKVTLKKPPKN